MSNKKLTFRWIVEETQCVPFAFLAVTTGQDSIDWPTLFPRVMSTPAVQSDSNTALVLRNRVLGTVTGVHVQNISVQMTSTINTPFVQTLSFTVGRLVMERLSLQGVESWLFSFRPFGIILCQHDGIDVSSNGLDLSKLLTTFITSWALHQGLNVFLWSRIPCVVVILSDELCLW